MRPKRGLVKSACESGVLESKVVNFSMDRDLQAARD